MNADAANKDHPDNRQGDKDLRSLEVKEDSDLMKRSSGKSQSHKLSYFFGFEISDLQLSLGKHQIVCRYSRQMVGSSRQHSHPDLPELVRAKLRYCRSDQSRQLGSRTCQHWTVILARTGPGSSEADPS